MRSIAACRQGTLRSLAGEMLAAPRGGSLPRADARRTAGGLTIRAERPGTFPGTRGVPTASIAAAPRKISAPTRTIHDQSRMLLQPIATPPAMVPRTTVTNNRTYCPIISASRISSTERPARRGRASFGYGAETGSEHFCCNARPKVVAQARRSRESATAAYVSVRLTSDALLANGAGSRRADGAARV